MPRRPGVKLSAKDLTKEDLRAVTITDEKIAERTDYGVRSEIAEEPSTEVVWSNGGACWVVYPGRIEQGTEVELDANEIIVPFSPARMDRIVDFLVELPLYRLSTEAKMRGVETPWRADMEWAEKQLERMTRERIEKAKEERER